MVILLWLQEPVVILLWLQEPVVILLCLQPREGHQSPAMSHWSGPLTC